MVITVFDGGSVGDITGVGGFVGEQVGIGEGAVVGDMVGISGCVGVMTGDSVGIAKGATVCVSSGARLAPSRLINDPVLSS